MTCTLPKSSTKINFRTITDDDLEFLYTVYRSTRIDEVGIAHWPEKEKEEFIRSQFMLQHTQYMQNYHNATFQIILLETTPVGRMYINWGKDEIRIIDLSLVTQHRNQGIGTTIFKDLIAKSDQMKTPLSLYVEYYNYAKVWYEKLGFKIVGESGVYYLMMRTPE